MPFDTQHSNRVVINSAKNNEAQANIPCHTKTRKIVTPFTSFNSLNISNVHTESARVVTFNQTQISHTLNIYLYTYTIAQHCANRSTCSLMPYNHHSFLHTLRTCASPSRYNHPQSAHSNIQIMHELSAVIRAQINFNSWPPLCSHSPYKQRTHLHTHTHTSKYIHTHSTWQLFRITNSHSVRIRLPLARCPQYAKHSTQSLRK